MSLDVLLHLKFIMVDRKSCVHRSHFSEGWTDTNLA